MVLKFPQIPMHTSILLNLKIQPLFTSIVWIGQLFGNQDSITNTSAVKCAETLKLNTIVLPHLTCYKMTKIKLNTYLNTLNFDNILALRGDFALDNQEFMHASDMVKAIRELRKDTISVGVAGYPDTHPEAKSKEEDLRNLKIKVDAGADFIITQLCFSATKIKEFITNCRDLDIKIPIIPGIFVPNSYRSLQRMCNITRVQIPNDLLAQYEKLSDDEEEFKKICHSKDN